MDSTKKLEDPSLKSDDKESVKDVTSNWRQILDLELAAKTETDWYSTRVFDAFLEAFDVNQPVILHDNNNETNKQTRGKSDRIGAEDSNKSDELKSSKLESLNLLGNENTSKANTSRHEKQGAAFGETILSAEALKILSELPDLSHMSSTRSFMFPNGGRKTQR